MIGASISGVTFVSVPGMVIGQNMAYAQTCMGFIFGYVLVAFVLLPIYYRLNLITIYSFLKERLGVRSYKMGASFFILSKMSGAAVKFYVVCMILQRFVLDAFNVPFPLTVVVLVLLIWLYTRKGGIRTLVFTDSFQTLCMFLTLLLIIYKVMGALDLNLSEAFTAVVNDSHSQIFVWDDWVSKQNFWKQFRCVHRCGDDGTRPRYDAKELDVQNLARCTEGYVYLWRGLFACQLVVYGFGRAAYDVFTARRKPFACFARRSDVVARSWRNVG